jgi:hypothetical protein
MLNCSTYPYSKIQIRSDYFSCLANLIIIWNIPSINRRSTCSNCSITKNLIIQITYANLSKIAKFSLDFSARPPLMTTFASPNETFSPLEIFYPKTSIFPLYFPCFFIMFFGFKYLWITFNLCRWYSKI